jgi:GT2 family glycosyltransferase
MKTSLIISTYNREDALELVLKSVIALNEYPDEVIIADDGSGLSTKKLITNHFQFPYCTVIKKMMDFVLHAFAIKQQRCLQENVSFS